MLMFMGLEAVIHNLHWQYIVIAILITAPMPKSSSSLCMCKSSQLASFERTGMNLIAIIL